jgi:hypothetical protein
MSSPDSPDQAKLICAARAHAETLVRAVADATSEPESVAASCDRASVAVDEYCADLLKHLISVNPPTSASDTAWIKSRFLTLIVEFGSAIRDAISDSETRHAAAQGIQFRVLEHERHLRPALESAALAHSPVVEINPGTRQSVSLAQQKPYRSPTDISSETV